ncbi:MAG: hypothetical protein PHI34_10095 [Acidobacteriota bacterium]|nr:hypothetical protein [Acidobacteriota bacterium]
MTKRFSLLGLIVALVFVSASCDLLGLYDILGSWEIKTNGSSSDSFSLTCSGQKSSGRISSEALYGGDVITGTYTVDGETVQLNFDRIKGYYPYESEQYDLDGKFTWTGSLSGDGTRVTGGNTYSVSWKATKT